MDEALSDENDIENGFSLSWHHDMAHTFVIVNHL